MRSNKCINSAVKAFVSIAFLGHLPSVAPLVTVNVGVFSSPIKLPQATLAVCFVHPIATTTGKCVNLSAPRKSCFYFPLLIFDRWSFWGLSTFLLRTRHRNNISVFKTNLLDISRWFFKETGYVVVVVNKKPLSRITLRTFD